MSCIVAPSIISADFGHLDADAKRLAVAGANAIHCDVMDGAFVPNLTIGSDIVAAINRATDLPLDVHLMVYNPYDYIERFVKAGADQISFHIEATEDVAETLDFITKCNVRAGLAICPETPVELLHPYLERCDHILIMTVHPGFGGQAFMPETVEKIEALRLVYKGVIQVDGGINLETAKVCRKAGASSFVSGSYLFRAPDMAAAIKQMQNI
jgi:ribulose-phosphate 3-epimerase